MGWDIVTFDLDGTLVDTAPAIAGAANRALQAHGVPACAQEQVARLIGHGGRALMLELLARSFLERPSLADTVRPESVLERFERELLSAFDAGTRPYPGAREALERLRRRGVRVACVSNKERRHACRVLQAAGLDDLFDLVVAGDSLPQKKPHASVLRHVVDTLRGDTRRAAHVGDSCIDVEAARNAGVAAWAVPYGYNAGRPIAEARPDRVFAGLQAVADHVLARRTAGAAPPAAIAPGRCAAASTTCAAAGAPAPAARGHAA